MPPQSQPKGEKGAPVFNHESCEALAVLRWCPNPVPAGALCCNPCFTIGFLILSHRICKNFFWNSFGLPISAPVRLGYQWPLGQTVLWICCGRMASAKKIVVASGFREPAIAAGLARGIHLGALIRRLVQCS